MKRAEFNPNDRPTQFSQKRVSGSVDLASWKRPFADTSEMSEGFAIRAFSGARAAQMVVNC
jgi:hypothetical protein